MLRALCGFMRRDGHEVYALVDRDGPLLDQLARDGTMTLGLPIATPGRFAGSWPRLVLTIRRLAPDVLHLHGQPAAFFGGLAGRAAGVRRIVYSAQFPAFHTDFDARRRLRNRLVERVSCRLASRVVCLSRWDQAEFVRRTLASLDQVARIPNCVDRAFFEAPPRPSGPRPGGLPSEGPLIVFVGRLTDQKGVETLIGAVPIIGAGHPGAHFVIAGDGPLRATLEGQARERALASTVTFTGALEDPRPFLRAADVVVVPSLFEPFGIIAAEALALGRPVVASRVGGLPDIVEHEVTGLLVPPANPPALAQAVCRILGASSAAREMGARGRERARREFSEEAVLPRYREIYLETLVEE